MQSIIKEKSGIMFKKTFIPFEKFSQISERDSAYAVEDPRLRPFYKYQPNFESLTKVIEDKKADKTDRELLFNALSVQYEPFNTSDATAKNIQSLKKNNTFTIITAHQPSLFTGPSYFIYKICSVLNLAKKLNATQTEVNVVPVFITGGEDHDFEEISSTQIFGNKITWKNDKGGSVGLLDTSSLRPVLDELKEILGDKEIASSIYATIENAFTKFKTYGQGMRYLINELFGEYGLIVADMSDPLMKRSFIPIIEKELFERRSVDFIRETVKEIELAGFSNQAHPREINFFYLGDGYRERIVFEEGVFKVLNQDISFTKDEITRELQDAPERFSPNVNMRPIYQEFIFPNLAYIGGGGELAYWMERKSQFEYFNINYPMLIRRNSVLIIDRASDKKMDKLKVKLEDLLQEEHQLINTFLQIHSENELSLELHKNEIEETYSKIIEITKEIDKSLIATVEAEKAKHVKGIHNLEGRLKKAEKNKFDIGINQIKKLQEKLFPGNSLQERKENFLTFYTRYGKSYLDYLVENLAPFEKGILVIQESDA